MTRERSGPFEFGELPVDLINRILDLELDPGVVVMPINAQKHALKRHPEEFPVYFPHVAAVVQSPLYVRDDFKNDGKIELVGQPLGAPNALLVAIEITLDAAGRYNVTSFYPISEQKIANRREKGTLKLMF
ncbi:hypothetical protein U1763_20965 [Sphingomonas sp. LB2R24]|jgi:hypothetical protein|uniref:PBECR3 domain-containing polyvalent protein n=1 Tax=Sphingomonas sorbitolis TaxID=3096165 RepID=UPI002FCB85B1